LIENGKRRADDPSGFMMGREITVLLLFAFSVLLILGFFNLTGTAGRVVNNILFGLFGSGAFVFPFVFFIVSALLIVNERSRQAVEKSCAIFFLYLDLVLLFAFGWNSDFETRRAGYAGDPFYNYSVEYKQGGGFIGGHILSLLLNLTGHFGVIVIMITLAVICLVIMTKKSIVRFVTEGSRAAAVSVRDTAYDAYEGLEERRNRRHERTGRVIHGRKQVTGNYMENLNLSNDRGLYSDEMRELSTGEEDFEDPSGGDIYSDQAAEEFYRNRADGEFYRKQEKQGLNRTTGHRGAPEEPEEELDLEELSRNIENRVFDEKDKAPLIFGGDIIPVVRPVREIISEDKYREDEVDLYPDEEISRGLELYPKNMRSGGEAKSGEEKYPEGKFSGESFPEQNFREEDDHPEEEFNRGIEVYPKDVRIRDEDPYPEDPYPDEEVPQRTLQKNIYDSFGEKETQNEETFPEETREAETIGEVSGDEDRDRDIFRVFEHTEKEFEELDRERRESDPSLKKRPVASSSVPEGIVVNEDQGAPLDYILPRPSMLEKGNKQAGSDREEIREVSEKLKETLSSFGVNIKITDVNCGPTVTRYEFQLERGVKVSKILGLTDDIKLALAAENIRIEAPIPGKSAVGIEVPNRTVSPVMLRDLFESREFIEAPSKLSFAVGKDIGGQVVVFDIAKMPHVLIAGATGAGKSVCINTIIMSILFKARPDEVKLIMIDPKVVELSIYNGIPHLLIPVVTDPQKAAGALQWGVNEMDRRYNVFAEKAVRDLKGYNAKAQREGLEVMPQLVIIVDELADLMMTAKNDVENAIVRLAQKARAAGIHLIIATQRPSVDVITGLIKANMPSRVAFTVTSGTDSRTILDTVGAEKLLGKGDMLFYPVGYPKPARVQGAFVSDSDVEKVAEFIRNQKKEGTDSSAEIAEQIEQHVKNQGSGSTQAQEAESNEGDELFWEVAAFVVDLDKPNVSVSLLQRRFRLGFNRAARIMDELHEAGIVGEEAGTKGRAIIMDRQKFEQMREEEL